ncbi:Serine/threonine phosphatase stp [Polystyrenella longa]|uniref:Serine/threonine phosphatase stp n=1 Tax=Polystyrenella longa TaxID=2528007 RepID=A0A518CL78_9PLAN|nr:protein phosphatase 2C domain-containing protein [Polystyrenella longa]QDU79983.1 Serine/threonine phosphatase stp [Polystyrenella longa]
MVAIRHGSVCITGNFRENNEDRCLADDQQRFFLVCDGMGGQAAGEKASELATELVAKKLNQLVPFESATAEQVREAVNKSIEHANLEIMALGEIEPEYHKMGTTIVFLLNLGDRLYMGGVGDSRIYLYRGGKLQQLTKDHSLTQALVEAGTIKPEEAATHRFRNVLFRYLGSKEGGDGVDLIEKSLEPGDRYLLCSDGVMDGASDDQLQELISSGDDPQRAAENIVDAALEGGSRDNITCLTIFV